MKDAQQEVTWELMQLLSERRVKKAITVRELGKRADVSYTVIYDFEQRSVLPKVETIIKLAEALDFEILCEKTKDGILAIKFVPVSRRIGIMKLLASHAETYSPEAQIRKLLNKKGLSLSDVNEVMSFIKYKENAGAHDKV